MSKDAPNLFISYARIDKDSAEALAKALDRVGMRPWLDVHELKVGSNLREELENAMRKADGVVCLVSGSASNSPVVLREWEAAVSTSWDKPNFRLIPVVEPSADPPGFLRDRAWIKIPDPAREEVDWTSIAAEIKSTFEHGNPADAVYREQAQERRRELLEKMQREIDALVEAEHLKGAGSGGA